MNDNQLLRYSRQIMLPGFGIEGQERLRAAHALVVVHERAEPGVLGVGGRHFVGR